MNADLLQVIQDLSYVFYRQNVRLCPFNVTYLGGTITPGTEKLLLLELLSHFNDLLIKYKQEQGESSKYTKYYNRCLFEFADLYDIKLDKARKFG